MPKVYTTEESIEYTKTVASAIKHYVQDFMLGPGNKNITFTSKALARHALVDLESTKKREGLEYMLSLNLIDVSRKNFGQKYPHGGKKYVANISYWGKPIEEIHRDIENKMLM